MAQGQTRVLGERTYQELHREILLSSESRADTGLALFHLNPGGGVACASCHPEAGMDGHVWNFAEFGPRVTQPLEGQVSKRAPFHWSGDLKDWPSLVGEVMMKRMAIEAIYRRPSTSKPAPGNKIYPYLLRGLAVERPNQAWAMDITYIPMARGFVYLAAVVDWFSRRVLSWRVSITMEIEFCLEAVEEALARHGSPEIFNTDQGSQFTSAAFTGLLLDNAIAISMDGKGAWRDNVFVERLWRSVKYEEVYLKAYDSVGEARASIGRYLDFFNRKRPHSSLDARTPDRAYFDHLPQVAAA